MYNLERIITAIKDVDKFFAQLEKIKKENSDLDDPKIFHSLSMLCLAIINRLIDIGSDIVVRRDLSMPSRYKEIFSLLSKEGVISKELGKEMEELAEHRNFLAHEYFGLDKKRLKRILRKINYVKDFIERIKKIIRL